MGKKMDAAREPSVFGRQQTRCWKMSVQQKGSACLAMLIVRTGFATVRNDAGISPHGSLSTVCIWTEHPVVRFLAGASLDLVLIHAKAVGAKGVCKTVGKLGARRATLNFVVAA